MMAFGLGVAESQGQTEPSSALTSPYSVIVSSMSPGAMSLLNVPGLDNVQLQMAHSIDNVCPNVSTLPSPTSAQVQLANVCGTMTAAAVKLLGGPNPLGLNLSGVPAGLSTLDGLKNALTQLNGGAETIVPTTQASVLRTAQASAIGSRLSILHTRMMGGGAGFDDPSSVTRLAASDVTNSQDSSPRIQLAQNTAAAPADVSMWSGKLGVFLNVIGQFGTSDTTGNQNGYSFNNEGFLAGADYQITPSVVVGLAFGYTYANTDFTVSPQSPPGQSLNGSLYQGNLYGTWYATDALYIDAVAAIGGGDNNSTRTVVVSGLPGSGSIATGNFGTTTYGVTVGGGYNIPLGALTLTPTLRFEYHRIESDGYTETGGGALNLTYGPSAENAVLSFLGGQASYAISTGFGVITPTARFNWAHQYNNGTTQVSVAYSNDALFSTVSLLGDPPTKNYYDLGVGVAMQLAGSVSGFVNYDVLLGLNHTSFNSFTAGVRYGF